MSDEWKSSYGEVVWVKSSGSWWPCFVYDPENLPTTCMEVVKTKSLQQIGKKYVIYFYADSNYQWVAKSAMKPFNDETKAEFEGQTVSKKYREVFNKSIEIAADEVKKGKEDRVSWHYTVAPSSFSPAPAPATDGVSSEPVQRKRGRLKKTPLTEESGERRVAKKKVVKLKRDGEDGDEDEKAKEEEEEEEDGAQEEADGDESKYEFDEDVPRQGKRGHLSKNNTAEKKKIALSSSSNSPPKKRGRPSKNPLAYASDKPRVLDVTPVTAVGTIMKKRQEERQSALFLEESVMDRLVRFCNILKVTSVKEGDGSDIPRTVKILDKLPQVYFPLFVCSPGLFQHASVSSTLVIPLSHLHFSSTVPSLITYLPLFSSVSLPPPPLSPSPPLTPSPAPLSSTDESNRESAHQEWNWEARGGAAQAP
mmetsp:Transcript_17697/g.39239  ORF Transcript_17697/g.39239 Transcript_17697/m.39239 type:complete len:422 (-) Transcript_17697:685-1950(-)